VWTEVNRNRSRLGETVAFPVIFGLPLPLSNDIVFIWRGADRRLGSPFRTAAAALERAPGVAHMFSYIPELI
jgi:hypothetical protein